MPEERKWSDVRTGTQMKQSVAFKWLVAVNLTLVGCLIFGLNRRNTSHREVPPTTDQQPGANRVPENVYEASGAESGRKRSIKKQVAGSPGNTPAPETPFAQ